MSDIITINGNLAADPELRRLPGGVVVTNFRVGTTHRRFDRDSGAWVEAGTNWYSVSAFRGLGEHAFHSLRKGHPVIVTGRVKVREYESGDAKKTSVDIEADTIGHDLRWGTTVYTKDGRSDREKRPEEAEKWTEPEQALDAWTVPASGTATAPLESTVEETDSAATPF